MNKKRLSIKRLHINIVRTFVFSNDKKNEKR